MKRLSRWFVAACVSLSAAVAGPAWADTFPNRPIRFVVPFPGGFTDVLARLVGAKMSDALGQPVLVENRPGGSGQIGIAEVMKAPADGHVLFLGHIGTHAINPHLFAKLGYDAEKDLVPVTLLVQLPNMLVVSPTVPAQSLTELVALAKAKPGTMAYASPGNGTSGHLAGELFKSLAGVDLIHVPYKGTAEALGDLAEGRVHLMFDTVVQGAAQAKAGKVRPLAVTSAQRQPVVPEVPTMAESGFPGWDTGPWFGIMMRAGTPDAVVRRVHAEAVKALAAPDVRERLRTMGATAVGDTPEAFGAFVRAESARWGKVVKDVGIRAD
jgi:tripartite-type tricarboxylate transporter receptor subunit TctC